MTEIIVTIEKLGLQGDGMTHEGLYVPLSLPGDVLKVKPLKSKGAEGAKAKIVEIITPSKDRITPSCAHFGVCGGCSLQHWAFAPYGAFKREQVEAILRRGGVETQIDPLLMTPPGTRRRIGLHAKKLKGRTELGFKVKGSWDQIKIDMCQVAEPQLIKALPHLTKLASYLFEHAKSAPILNVTLTDTGLDIDISGVERSKTGGLSADGRVNLAIVAAEADFARVSLGEEIVYQSRMPRVRFGKAVVDLPPGSFLQASQISEGDMIGLVTGALKGASKIADLFCGVGTFSFPLAEQASLYAADSTAPAIAALKSAVGKTPGLKSIQAEVRDLFRRPLMASEMTGLDAVVFDPPRAGAEAQTREIAQSKVERVIGISCNPQTFARDAKILIEAGFTLEKVTPIDQFLWSSHIELVAVFTR